MFLRFALLLTIVIIAVQGEISLSTIQTDAAKLAQIYQQYTSHSGGAQMLGAMRQTCPWLIECCPNELAHFTTLMFDNKFFGNVLVHLNLSVVHDVEKLHFQLLHKEKKAKVLIHNHDLPNIFYHGYNVLKLHVQFLNSNLFTVNKIL